MFEMKMISRLPSGSLDGALGLLTELKWNVSLSQQGNMWMVFGGEKCLLKSSSKEAAQAFIYGLALAYCVMPDTILEQVRRYTRESDGE